MDISRVTACTYPLRERPVEEAFDVIAAAGYTRVDLLGRMPHLSLDPAECKPSAVMAAAAARGLRIANLGTYVGRAFGSDDPAAQEAELGQARRAIDLAALLGARSIRVMAGDDDPSNLDRIAAGFRRAAEHAAARGIYMGFETHGGRINGSPEQARALCSLVGSPYFGVLYDPCNLAHAGTDYRAALATFGEHVVHVHFKDGRRTQGGFEPTMLGEGEIDFVWTAAELDRLGYRGDFALEYELPAPEPEVGLPRWLAAWRALT